MVKKCERISLTHIRKIESSKIKSLEFPEQAMIGRVIASDIVDKNTGEICLKANTVIDEENLEIIRDLKLKQIETLYINDIESGPYISDTLRSDSTTNQIEALVEIYRMMRPGEPPTKDAALNLFNNLFFNPERYDFSAVGRMKFNKRLGREEIPPVESIAIKATIPSATAIGTLPKMSTKRPRKRSKNVIAEALLCPSVAD